MKYNYFQKEKLEYEDIEIPDELLMLVRRTVASDRRKRAAVRRRRILKTAASVAAILFLCLTIGVNSSYAFAETAVKIPVVKSIAKSVVVRSYRQEIIAVYEESKKGRQSGTPADPEQPPAEQVPAVSDNDVISENIVQPEPLEEPAEETTGGLDAWKAEMTLEKFREVTERYTPDMEERYADAPEKLRTILLAEVPEKDISLYGYHEEGKITGVALRIKDNYQYFDWNYMNESKRLPDISVTDIDEDGEEEIVVLLYNGALQIEQIAKEDIPAPKDQTAKDNAGETDPKKADQETDASDTVKTDESRKNADGSEKADENGNVPDSGKADGGGSVAEAAGSAKSDSAENVADHSDSAKAEIKEGGQETDPAENLQGSAQDNSVSGNDMGESTKPEEKPAEQAGELWVISPTQENWEASVLSAEDYENQILHQLKAEYNDTAGTLQLYRMEEPFGDLLKPDTGEADSLTYESLAVASGRKVETEDGLVIRFEMEAVFRTGTGEKVTAALEPKMKAEITLTGDALTVENIEQ